jgi:Ca2+-binding EF-hand superfamily protein
VINPFYFFFSQIISLTEFRVGCKILNDNLPSDSQLVNIDETLKLMDFDGSGSIDINEFFEVR